MSPDLRQRLAAAGLGPAQIENKCALFLQAEQAVREMAGGRAGEIYRRFIPGRVEVLGKHTDYAGGRSLLCAVERGFGVVASPRSDAIVQIRDVVKRRFAQVALSPQACASATDWTVYPRAVLTRLASNFPLGPSSCAGSTCGNGLRGADIAFGSDLPSASGLSSSSALVVTIFMVVSAFNRLHDHRDFQAAIRSTADLAGYLGCIENGQSFGNLTGDRGVGTFGGSEDHTAMLCCRAGHLSQYAFCPVREERVVPLPAPWTFVVAASGIAASKTGAVRERYNRASLAAQAILKIWRETTGRTDPTLSAAATHAPNAPAQIRSILSSSSHPDFAPQELVNRFEQFFSESEVIIPAATEAIERCDGASLGKIVDRSQAGAEKLLGNQVPETVELARSARVLGAIAASSFGAGFGGSVWALVPAAGADEFRSAWARHYARSFPAAAKTSEFFITGAGPGTFSL